MGGASGLRKGGSARRGLFVDNGEDGEKGEQELELELGQRRPPVMTGESSGDEGDGSRGDEEGGSRGQAAGSDAKHGEGKGDKMEDSDEGDNTKTMGNTTTTRWRDMQRNKENTGQLYKGQLDIRGQRRAGRSIRTGARQRLEYDGDGDKGSGDEVEVSKVGAAQWGGSGAAQAKQQQGGGGAHDCDGRGDQQTWGRKGSREKGDDAWHSAAW